jgi:hypothetical protein
MYAKPIHLCSSNDKMILNDDLGRVQQNEVVTYFKVVLQHGLRKTTRIGLPSSGLRFIYGPPKYEPGILTTQKNDVKSLTTEL